MGFGVDGFEVLSTFDEKHEARTYPKMGVQPLDTVAVQVDFSLGANSDFRNFIKQETRYLRFPETGLFASKGGTEFSPFALEAGRAKPENPNKKCAI